MDKVINPGATADGLVFCKVQYDGRRLSISGVEGPTRDGNCRGSCGQIAAHLPRIETLGAGWTREMVSQFGRTWERWHLNDMRAGCEHQRADNWGSERIEVVSYKLTSEAYRERERAIVHAARCTARGELADLTATERALIALENWFMPVYSPPDADGPFSGCYEVDKRETKTAGWVKQSEHPRGVMCKPCPTCGYQYGTAWLTEEVPADVIAALEALPDSTLTPAWV